MTRKTISKNIWNKKTIEEVLFNLAQQSGCTITKFAKGINDNACPTKLSKWMDSAVGRGHRIKRGHDPIANCIKVYKKFGAKGVLIDFPKELAIDATSPDGIPIGAEKLRKANLISTKFGTEWCSLNWGDLIAGGFAVAHSYKLYIKVRRGNFTKSDCVWAIVGSISKTIGGVTTHNPILLLSGIFDGLVIVSNYKEFAEFVPSIKKLLTAKVTQAAAVGVIGSGAGVAATYASVATFGVASTGTSIATLSGAAASKATLAAIGGGSLATGGLGIFGGVLILGGGALLLAGGCAYGAYQLISD